MKSKAIQTGEYFEHGDNACAEGAIAAGCRYFAGYPITPATEIAERMSNRLPEVGGTYMQMEDELASLASVIGASYAGTKAMTATSGPGLSLMNENIGLAAMTEAPCVIVDVMRAGPSTGQPTESAQGDIMQAKWGSHGDYEIIALAPNSTQEMFNLTIEAFNLSEQYRVPTLILADAIVAHTREKLIIPPSDKIHIINRAKPADSHENYLPFKADPETLVPPMACFGEGYHFHATGLTHDERGYPDTTPQTQQKLITRLCDKIRKNADKITRTEETLTADAEVIVVAYGSTSRSALKAIRNAREQGIKAGLLRPITIWPFPEKRIRETAKHAKAIVVPEANYGQLVREVERFAGITPVQSLPKPNSELQTPDEILEGIRRALQ